MKEIPPEYKSLIEFKNVMDTSTSKMKRLNYSEHLDAEYSTLGGRDSTWNGYTLTYDKFVLLANEFGRFSGFEIMKIKSIKIA